MERPSGRRRRRMSSGRSPAPSERRTRLHQSVSGQPVIRAASTSASSNASNDRTPTPDQPSSSSKKDSGSSSSRPRSDSTSTSQAPDSIRPLRRSARLKLHTLPPIDTNDHLNVNVENARASRSPRRRGGGDMQPSTSRVSDGIVPSVATVNVSNMVEPTIGVALGALGAAAAPIAEQAVQQAVRQGVIGEAQLLLNTDPHHHHHQVVQQQHQQLRNSLQQLASFPQTPNLVSIQSFQQPNPYPTFPGLFAPSFSGANGFPPPFYSSIGFAQPFTQDFDWRVPQMSTSTAAAAAMFAPPIYQTPISFVQQLAGHAPSTSAASNQSNSAHQHILQMPPSYARTQRFDLHSRISQAVRNTLQHVRVLDGSRQPDPTLLENLQSSDLWRKREAVQTISNLILISDEGANLNVSFRDIVAAIKDLLQHEDFNTKSDGVTCLQNLVDVFSRSHSVAADAIPLLIALMSDVREEYGVDIHETALKPLLILSRKYGRNILQAGGLSGVLRHLYFFNQHAQRSAIEVVANAASYVSIAHIEQVGEALKEITDNMNNADSKMGDAACAAFSKIVCNLYEEETFVNDVLQEKYDLACKIVQVLRDLSTKFSATTELLRAVRLLMACNSDFAAKLHHVGITSTIATLLSPLSSKRSINSFIDLRELIFMCGELAPPLPDTNIFSIDRLIVCKSSISSRSHASSWPSTSSEERPVDGICCALTAPLIAITASVTDPMVHFDVLRVLVRLLLPCRRVDLFEVLGESDYANAVMLVSLLKEALLYNPQKLHISVAAVQLIRTMLEKDSSKITAAHLCDHGIWEAVEKLGATVGNNKGGPITRNRSKALADVITSSRKRTSPASSPSVKRERDNGGSSRSTSNVSGGSKKSHLHSLLSFRSHSSDAASSTQSSRPSSPYDSQIRQLSEIDQSEVCTWLATECSHALRLRPEPGLGDNNLEKLLHELRHKQDASAIPLSFFKELIKLTHNCLAPNQILKSGLQEEVLKWMSDGSSTRVVPSLIAALQKVDSADRSPHLGSLIKAVAGAVDQCEAFPVNIFDLSAHAAPHLFHGANALRYFRNHVVTITVSRHPKCDSNEPSQSNTFKTDPLVTMKYIYTVVRNRLPIRQSSSSEDDEDSQGGPFQSPDIELLSANGQVIGEQQVLLEVLLANSTDNIGHILATSHHFHYRPKKAGNPVRHIEPKISLEQRIREELSRSTETEFTSLPTTSGVALVAEFLEGKRVFEKNMMKKIDRIAQSVIGHLTGDGSPLAAHFATSLGMLTLLHYVDLYWAVDGCQGYWPEHPFSIAHKEDFICKKLDAKVNRQVADFLSVAAQGLPSWIEWIARNAPFILSFETRRSFFHLSAFGRERALSHWLQQRDITTEDATFMRVKKVTIEVSRENFLQFAYAALHDTPTGSTMEVKFRGEAGTGHGPTQEFYSILSREFKKASLNLWYPNRIEVDPETSEKLIAADHGLFPLPCSKEQRMEKIRLYELLGRALGQALQDGKRLDIVLNPIVMKYLIGKAHLIGPCDLANVDPLVYKSMKQIEECANEELELIMAEYSIPNVNIDISTNSSEQTVNAKNRWTYLERFRELMLLTIREPLEAIVHGLNSAFPREHLECFLPDEFEALFCGAGGADAEYWMPEKITEALKFDLGYSRESATVKNFVQMLTEFPPAKRQRFLQFVTGSPRLPHGGFAALSPPLTVVCKSTSSGSPDGEFPSAVTCKNYVKLPNYSSYEVTVRQFEIALTNALHFDYN